MKRTITTEADKAAFWQRLAGYYENSAARQVKPAERDKLTERAAEARTHAATYTA